MMPSEWVALPLREKAMIWAFVEEKAKSDKAEMAKMKRGRRR